MAASYSAEWDALFAQPSVDARQRMPTPSMAAQAQEPGAKLIPLSHEVYALPKLNNWVHRERWTFLDAVVSEANLAGAGLGLGTALRAAP